RFHICHLPSAIRHLKSAMQDALSASCYRSASLATYRRSSSPNHGGEPAAALSRIRATFEVAGIATWHRGSLSPHLSCACDQVATPNGASGARSAGDGGCENSRP